METIDWPESGVYGRESPTAIASACSGVGELSEVDCVICENLSSAPVMFQLRRQGYSGPVVVIPHVNPYPTRNFVHALLWSGLWGPRDVVVAGSPVTARRYESLFGMRSEPMPTYGVDESVYLRRDKDAARSRFGLSGAPLMLYTGRLAPDKNIGALIATYRSVRRYIPEVELVMAVRFVDVHYKSRLGALADVKILDNLSPPELADLYCAADVFLSCATSYHETFGMSPLEAMTCGCPVVLPDWDGFRSYARGDGHRLVPVNFLTEPVYDRWSYAMADLSATVRACVDVLITQPRADPAPKQCTRTWFESRFNGLLLETLDGTGSARRGQERKSGRLDPLLREAAEHLSLNGIEEIFRLATCSEAELPMLTGEICRNLYIALYG
ncbi:glycosyltransferase family 4 protein [Amycolatopsis pigmentata]|uniref:Glycosyltransferase family 4 protein n=1 Tax=Amycolatopsis pigmentata TaxID=450801 RepID=A0ABW5G0X8_9PSEU